MWGVNNTIVYKPLSQYVRLEHEWYMLASVQFSIVLRTVFVVVVGAFEDAPTNTQWLSSLRRLHLIAAKRQRV